MGWWCLMSCFQPFSFCSFLLSSKQGWGQWQSNRCFAPAHFAITFFPPSFSCQPSLSTCMAAKLCCLVATSSMYLHCFGTGFQTLLSSQLCLVQHWRGRVSDSLSAFGKLGLDLYSLRCGGTAFNVLMIKREIILHSVQLGCMNGFCLGKQWRPKLRLLFDPQCALWFWYRHRRERKQQAES